MVNDMIKINPSRPNLNAYVLVFNVRFCVTVLPHKRLLYVYLQLKAPAPQISSSARPPCTASPNSGSVMRTLTVQTGQTRLIAVSFI